MVLSTPTTAVTLSGLSVAPSHIGASTPPMTTVAVPVRAVPAASYVPTASYAAVGASGQMTGHKCRPSGRRTDAGFFFTTDVNAAWRPLSPLSRSSG
jgi:hypothetical protein